MPYSDDEIRYASAEDVLLALDKEPEQVSDRVVTRAKTRAAAATRKWITQTGRPFHPVRIGDTGEPRSWESHDSRDVLNQRPVSVRLDQNHILPIDPNEGDTIEVREGRDGWRDITDGEGKRWDLDYSPGQLTIYRRHIRRLPLDDPRKRFVRLTYRYGPLGETVEINTDGVVESAPADVTEAVAAKAAGRLALDDEVRREISDSGQLTDPETKRSAMLDTWESTTGDYSGFSTF